MISFIQQHVSQYFRSSFSFFWNMENVWPMKNESCCLLATGSDSIIRQIMIIHFIISSSRNTFKTFELQCVQRNNHSAVNNDKH